MAGDDLSDSPVSLHQCKLAIAALHKHETKAERERQENQLLPGKEQYIWLVLAVKHVQTRKKIMPFRIPIVHPITDPRTTAVCLITKDPQREYKDLLEANKIKFISRVVGIEKLKGKFKPFEARRMLLRENGLFLADERVIPLLPGLLGKKFFQAKKQPIPVCLTRKDLKSELERAISSTYMHQNLGTCTSIKIGTLSQTPEQILANLKSALPAVVSRVKGGWSEIQSFHIKTNSSVSLPIWTCSLDEGEHGRWAEPSRGEKVAGGVEDSKLEADEEAAEQTQQKVKGAKGAKPGSAVTGSSEKAKSGEKSATKSRKGSESAVTKEPSLTPMRAEAIEASKVDSKGVPVDGVIAGNKRKRKGDLTNPVPAKLSVDSHIAKMPTANNALPHSSSSAAGEDPQIKPKKKKGKGSKATSTQTSDEASIAEGPQIKPKKKGKGSKATTTQTSDEASIAEAPRAYSPSVPVLPPPPQTSKKGKSETGARSDGPPVALSQGGVKEKRRNETGEKRKQKVVKAKAGAGAGAKDVVLGRKPGRVS